MSFIHKHELSETSLINIAELILGFYKRGVSHFGRDVFQEEKISEERREKVLTKKRSEPWRPSCI